MCNSMKWQVLLVTVISGAGLTASALAGHGAGNGGTAVVCRDEAGQIIPEETELLDFFEARTLEALVFEETADPWQDQVDSALDRLGSDKLVLSDLTRELDQVKKSFEFVKGDGVGLAELDDTVPTLRKKGCQIEQLANYTSEGRILVDFEIYAVLSETERAGLYLHEAVYSLNRKAKRVDDSRMARRITAMLLAQNTDIDTLVELARQELVQPLPPGTQLVELPDSADGVILVRAEFSKAHRTKEWRITAPHRVRESCDKLSGALPAYPDHGAMSACEVTFTRWQEISRIKAERGRAAIQELGSVSTLRNQMIWFQASGSVLMPFFSKGRIQIIHRTGGQEAMIFDQEFNYEAGPSILKFL